MDQATPQGAGQPSNAVQGAGQARWSTLAALGFAFGAAAPLLMFIAGITFGLDLGEFAAFLLLPIVLLGATAFLVRRFGTWSKIVGIVLGLAGLFLLWWTVFGVFSPTSFFDFVPGVLFTPGLLLAIISCIASLVAKRRGHFTPAAEGGEARGIRIAITLAALLAVVSGILTFATKSSVGDASAAAARASMKDFKFAPKQYSVAGGSKILVSNKDPFRHTFTVDTLAIDQSFGPRSAKLITVPEKPGTYYLYCSLHAPKSQSDATSDDMWVTLVVT